MRSGVSGTEKPLRLLARCKSAVIGVAGLSGIVNVLMLTGSIFMMEVYDRVLPSRSIPTLIGLATVALSLYIFMGIFDMIRNRILARIGDAFDAGASSRVYDLVLDMPLRARHGQDPLQPTRDLDQVRSFLSSNAPAALFDLPWLPFYLLICFAFHFWIGMTALIGSIFLVALTLWTEIGTRKPVRDAFGHATARNLLADGGRRNAEVIRAMGMAKRMNARWSKVNRDYVMSQRRAADVSGGLGAFSRVARMILQSAVLAVGAYLVIQQEATAGIIIASSILVARAVSPVEQVIANWRNFAGARQSFARLRLLFAQNAQPAARMALPAPERLLSVTGLAVIPPGEHRIVVQDVTFSVRAGSALGVIGPSASGKSSLVRALVGVWSPAGGKVRLDGVDLEQWPPERLGSHVGYLPQDVELFTGSVAENISRFDPSAQPDKIIAAANAAAVHEMIIALPDGYDTQIGEAGIALSGGQRQRIGLARALYGDPFFVVLDEPNSNLDAEGEQALTRAILNIRARKGIAVVVAHRPSAIAGADLVLCLSEGKMAGFGPKEEVLHRTLAKPEPMPLPMKAGAERSARL